MKTLKKILLGILGIVVLALVAGLFMKKDYSIERQVTVNKPKQEVFNYVKYLKNQDNYSTWNKKDPAMKKDFKGTDGEVGAVAVWDSEKKEVGAGEQEIKKIADGDRVDLELRFKKPYEMTNSAYMVTEMVDTNQTKVKWGFNGSMPYPMNIMMPFMNMEKMLGDELQKGLDDLKGILEK